MDSSPDYQIPSYQELLDFWGSILSTPTGASVGITTAPSPSCPSDVPLPKDSDSDDFDIKSESDSDSDSDCEGLTHDETAAFWGGLLPGSTSFNVHGPLLSNKDDSDDSDFESEVDDEEMEDIALDEAFEFAQDEDDEAREFLDEPKSSRWRRR